jgi:hypothetical protein
LGGTKGFIRFITAIPAPILLQILSMFQFYQVLTPNKSQGPKAQKSLSGLRKYII